ncbi:MAG TPA: hypothetical protein VN915_00905 [Elusimicrobiota bacterium]|nr:hypothetical protein [Elusimicrobiota bacterium]
MKKALEAAVVVAVLALGAFVVRQAFARRDAAARPMIDPALGAGPDVDRPGQPYAPEPSGAARSLPMIKLSRPPKTTRRPAAVPPPSR